MIKNLEMIVVVPMVLIKNILTIADIIVLAVAIGTMDVDRDMQAIVVNRALRTKPPGGRQPPKYLPVILKEDVVRKEKIQRNHFPGWR